MKRLSLLALSALPTFAQGALFQEDTALPPSLGVHLMVGLPRGEADRDLNHHVGYGLALSYPWHLGGRHLLRPNLEYNQYRLSPQPSPSWAPEAGHTLAFHTWKVGIDYVVYQEPWVYRGPYVVVGAGLQYSKVDHPVQNGSQTMLMDHRSSLAAPWAGAGLGYQFTADVGLELRYSVAAYAAERDQPLAGYTLTEPVRRSGQALHLILALRAPF